MRIAIKEITIDQEGKQLVQELYEAYAAKLLAYTRKNYTVPEDDAVDLVYKTIYRIADVKDRYSFENEHKRNAFIFKTFINYLRNYYRDRKSFENRHLEVSLQDIEARSLEQNEDTSPKLRLLEKLLDELQDWERILLLMRGQGVPYLEISKLVQKPEKQLKVYYGRLKKSLLENMNTALKRGSSGKG